MAFMYQMQAVSMVYDTQKEERSLKSNEKSVFLRLRHGHEIDTRFGDDAAEAEVTSTATTTTAVGMRRGFLR